MRHYDGSTHDIGYCKKFIHFFRVYAQFVRFAQMVFNTIIAAQYHAGYEAKQFLGFYIQCTGGVSVGIQIPQSFNNKIILIKNYLIHSRSVLIKFLYDSVHLY